MSARLDPSAELDEQPVFAAIVRERDDWQLYLFPHGRKVRWALFHREFDLCAAGVAGSEPAAVAAVDRMIGAEKERL